MEDPSSSILERNLYLRKVPLRNRSTVRLLQGAVGVGYRIQDYDPSKRLHPHTSALKPMLTDVNKMARLKFCSNKRGANAMYNAMYDRVHVDGKWLFLTQVCMHLAANG